MADRVVAGALVGYWGRFVHARGSARLNGITGSTGLSSSGCGEMTAKK
jgi:hypothetical protein